MLVEGLGQVTFVNGILRVQCLEVDASGADKESGSIEIPSGSLAAVLNGLVNATKEIDGKLKDLQDSEAEKNKKDSKGKKNKKN